MAVESTSRGFVDHVRNCGFSPQHLKKQNRTSKTVCKMITTWETGAAGTPDVPGWSHRLAKPEGQVWKISRGLVKAAPLSPGELQ